MSVLDTPLVPMVVGLFLLDTLLVPMVVALFWLFEGFGLLVVGCCWRLEIVTTKWVVSNEGILFSFLCFHLKTFISLDFP